MTTNHLTDNSIHNEILTATDAEYRDLERNLRMVREDSNPREAEIRMKEAIRAMNDAFRRHVDTILYRSIAHGKYYRAYNYGNQFMQNGRVMSIDDLREQSDKLFMDVWATEREYAKAASRARDAIAGYTDTMTTSMREYDRLAGRFESSALNAAELEGEG